MSRPSSLSDDTVISWTKLQTDMQSIRRSLVMNTSNYLPEKFHFRLCSELAETSTVSTDLSSLCTQSFKSISNNQTTINANNFRLYYIGTNFYDNETSLFFIDLDEKFLRQSTSLPVIDYLSQAKALLSSSDFIRNLPMSRAEQLLRERMRSVYTYSITAYTIVDQRILYQARGRFYYYDDTLNANKRLAMRTTQSEIDFEYQPIEIQFLTSGSPIDVTMCPHNSNMIGFIRNDNIWCKNLISHQELQCTFARLGTNDFLQDVKSAGVPSFVIQEEFSRYRGYWWQPKCHTNEQVYRILYEEVNDEGVDVVYIPIIEEDSENIETFRYPRAGGKNSESTLKLLEIYLNENNEIIHIVQQQLCIELKTIVPWIEYLARAGWTPDGNFVWIQAVNRSQTKKCLILIPLNMFDDADKQGINSNTQQQFCFILHEEINDILVKVHDILHFLPSSNTTHVRFVIATEETGYLHLQYLDIDLQASSFTDSEYLTYARVVEHVRLTDGEWCVNNDEIWIDEYNKLVYFTGFKDTPLETHLYVTSWLYPTKLNRLTVSNYSHTVTLNKETTLFLSTYSSLTNSPQINLYMLENIQSNIDLITVKQIGSLLPSHDISRQDSDNITPAFWTPVTPQYQWSKQELFEFQWDNVIMYGIIMKPINFETGRQYPTVLQIYGGPEVSSVRNLWSGYR
ncbi:unnamed protein product [Didymodactylos carnosus]|uniref:Dipeptidylpeptidase IV N-terminal domain-containing protein n=1 Tax=Didymodactylos carnosus TaxID=1234261 RepID=A0A814JCM8_9BILA|nr:unnamed protein product [Didymodactylos carnosus]CAF1178045.1 unnamed protein product [Didymodactylos carnosus]CAF3804792.1 unnamed protein product [Didymodactylos carnosus]CAF3989405.1 unnamed protein product [Didymodactylos carnosus]